MTLFSTNKTALKLTILFLAVVAKGYAQSPVIIHSHNDYKRNVPFYQAYSQGIQSIEIDLFLQDGKLLIGHDAENLKGTDTFESMYIEPVKRIFFRNGGKAWADSENLLQFVIEIKSADTFAAMDKIVASLTENPDVFNPRVNKDAVRITITGNMPEPDDFCKYPEYISFDGDLSKKYTALQLDRISMFSSDFSKYSQWNGKGAIIPNEEKAIKKAIEASHSLSKPIRFWNTPEGITPYYTFYNMGIDYFNSDNIEACAAFFSDFSNKNFQIGAERAKASGVTGTKKLDKITRDFDGFSNAKLQLSKAIEVYSPTYLNDGGKKRIKNVIFLIGDGMGLNQITAGYYANKGLSLMKMRNIGIQVNNAIDAFTTDSAAGGSALATGESHACRHISMTQDGREITTLSDYFRNIGKAVGVLTLGNVADATPAAFYGHATDRDSSDLILSYLDKAHIDLLCGSGKEFFEEKGYKERLSKKFTFVENVSEIGTQEGKIICIDEKMGEAADESNLTLLADATKESIAKLSDISKKGFFLMVEGAKIDYAGHSRCFPGSVIEMLSFDLAIAEAMKFADSNGETLVVVTADHETGGMVVIDGDVSTGRVMGLYFSDDHTPSMIPVFAYGPGSDRFKGVYPNTEISKNIKNLIGK